MKINQIVPIISTMVDKKRIASQYVIDYRNLDESALNDAINKTAPQYYNEDNVRSALTELLFHSDRDLRVLHKIILKTILLNQDDFLLEQKKLDDKVIDIEQEIINISNEEIQIKNAEKNNNIELFKFILEAAWDRNDDISSDEKNLIEKVKQRLKVSDKEYQIIEAKLGKFPKPKNEIHLRDEIKKCRSNLQSYGLLFCFRTEEKVDYDIVPEEIAKTLRSIWEIEIKSHGFRELLNSKYVRGKQYLMDILDKTNTVYDKYANVEELQELIISHVRPSIVLGGITPRDGLDASELTEWCKKLSLSTTGQKNDLIKRIIEYYDDIKESFGRGLSTTDDREILFTYYTELAERKLDVLRKQGIITKDIDCEKYFEKATYYIFEKFLGHKPLQLAGVEHPDGILSYKDKLILWDNKSKESDVNLKDHIKQFDRYIMSSKKTVAAFLVIGPEFTDDSVKEAMKYNISNDTPICLLSSSELKKLAVEYSKLNKEEPFPLANFIQPGRIRMADLVY